MAWDIVDVLKALHGQAYFFTSFRLSAIFNRTIYIDDENKRVG